MITHLAALPRAADGTSMAHLGGAEESSLTRRVYEVMGRTEYRRCDRGEDLEDIFRLRYKSYRRHGVVADMDAAAIRDELDETQNVYLFGVYVDGQLVSTLRIHHLDAEQRTGPSTQAFGDVVHPMLDAGLTFVDPSRFAVDPEWSRIYPQIPYITLRLVGMACLYFEAPYGLSTIREDHAAFYKRIYNSVLLGGPRSYPGVTTRVSLYRTDVTAIREQSLRRFPFFWSSHFEQRLMFARPRRGQLAPLTILPTTCTSRVAA